MEKIKFASLRISEPLFEKVKDMRLAFESAYGQRITNDEFVEKLLASVEGSEPAVWEQYGIIVLKREEKGDL